MTLNEFAVSIRKKIAQVTASSQSISSTSVGRESKKSLQDLDALLKLYEFDQRKMDAETLTPFIEFLRCRYERIMGTDGEYKFDADESQANVVCIYLANMLSKIDNGLKWPGKKPNEFLTPAVAQQNQNVTGRNEKLYRYIFSECNGLNEILAELVQYRLAEWQSCLADFDAAKLKKALFPNQMPQQMKEMEGIKALFSDDLRRNKALLCCLFQVYINERNTKPEWQSFFGLYNKSQKIAAAKAVQDYIVQGNDMADFNLPDLKEHARALQDGTLQLFKEMITVCVSKQPEMINQTAASAAACR